MRMDQLSESDAVDALRPPVYSSRYATGSRGGGISLIWGIPAEDGPREKEGNNEEAVFVVGSDYP